MTRHLEEVVTDLARNALGIAPRVPLTIHITTPADGNFAEETVIHHTHGEPPG
ncbi:hypothetical protein ABTZ03_09695 [Kitasatospora sp. NPDC096077]|uniref:hypothetical protein n=1 Tax=Kitasatospora sp. NPDC096077 TaxID=3155544 RepID=UPI00332435E2